MKGYKFGSIAHRMVTDVVKVSYRSTIADILKKLKRGKKFETIDYVYVLNDKEILVGVISIQELFNRSSNTRVNKIMKRKIVKIDPETDQEKVAHLSLKHGIKAIPVVEKGKLLGVVTAQDILHILNKSLHEDILHFAGIHKSHLNYENTTKVPLFLAVLHRLPWLIVGLVGIMIAAAFIGIFKLTLENYIILAFFIPAIVYMSGALGTQHQTLFVRDLAIMGKELNFVAYFLRQTFIAIILGLLISSLTMLGIFLFWNEFFAGVVITISLFMALMTTNFTSLITTFFLYKLGKDPALGSGPLATVISDMTSIVIYFLMATWLL